MLTPAMQLPSNAEPNDERQAVQQVHKLLNFLSLKLCDHPSVQLRGCACAVIELERGFRVNEVQLGNTPLHFCYKTKQPMCEHIG